MIGKRNLVEQRAAKDWLFGANCSVGRILPRNDVGAGFKIGRGELGQVETD